MTRTHLLITGLMLSCVSASVHAQALWQSVDKYGYTAGKGDAIVAGQYGTVPLFVCRARLVVDGRDMGLQPGHTTRDSSQLFTAPCQFSWGGKRYAIPHSFEVLVASWQWNTGGYWPAGTVQGGSGRVRSSDPNPLFFCRGYAASGSRQLGFIGAGIGGCRIPYGGTTQTLPVYEVLLNFNAKPMVHTVPAYGGGVPADAIRAGQDDDGEPLYVCSASYNGLKFPGKLKPSFGSCLIPVGTQEVWVSSYDVLVVSWADSFNLPANAPDFQAGVDSDQQPLYACRASTPKGKIPGKFRADFFPKCCLYGDYADWSEHGTTTFDLLTSK